MAETPRPVNEPLEAQGEQGVRTVTSRGETNKVLQMVEMVENAAEMLRWVSGLMKTQGEWDAEAVMARWKESIRRASGSGVHIEDVSEGCTVVSSGRCRS
jgi:hypothetical protein